MHYIKRFIEFIPEIGIAIVALTVIWGGFQWFAQRMDARWDCLIAEVQRPGVLPK